VGTELEEALAASQVGALIPKAIDPVILEYVRRYAPMARALPTVPWHTNTYYFNQRTVLPPGGFVTDGGARPVGNSTYLQNSFNIKLLQAIGSVTGFSQVVTADLVGSLKQREIEGTLMGLAFDLETALCWGNSAATAGGWFPQFDGFDTQVSAFSGATQNAVNRAGATFALSDLDTLIDLVEQNAAMAIGGSPFAFICSGVVNSKIAQLLTNQQRYMTVEVAPGLNVASYRDIPILKTSFLSARLQQMGTVNKSTQTTLGSLPDATTYKYQVSAVIDRYGEIAASTEVSQATGSPGTGANTITLAFSTPTGPDGASPNKYRVYRTAGGGAGGTETLLGVVDAFDSTGSQQNPTAVTTIIDNGTALLTNSAANTVAALSAGYVGGNSSQPPLATGEENIYLVPLDDNFLVRPYTRDFELINLAPTTTAPDQLPFAVVSDTCLAIRGPKWVARLIRMATGIA
jgi:hypothetical protein